MSEDVKDIIEEVEEVEETKEPESMIEDFYFNYCDCWGDDLASFLSEKMLSSFHNYTEDDNLEEYDFAFRQLHIKHLIEYSKLILEDVRKNSKKQYLKDIVTEFKDDEDLIWHDIYSYLAKNKVLIAQYIMENN